MAARVVTRFSEYSLESLGRYAQRARELRHRVGSQFDLDDRGRSGCAHSVPSRSRGTWRLDRHGTVHPGSESRASTLAAGRFLSCSLPGSRGRSVHRQAWRWRPSDSVEQETELRVLRRCLLQMDVTAGSRAAWHRYLRGIRSWRTELPSRPGVGNGGRGVAGGSDSVPPGALRQRSLRIVEFVLPRPPAPSRAKSIRPAISGCLPKVLPK